MTRINGVVIQSGALPYREDRKGKIQVRLVTAGRSKRWDIPKGKAEPHLSLAQNAAKEAFEEAGVIGETLPNSLGMFRSTKRMRYGDGIVEVWVYLLKVEEIAKDWPERKLRQTKWISAEKAMQILREPLLQTACERLTVDARLRAEAAKKAS